MFNVNRFKTATVTKGGFNIFHKFLYSGIKWKGLTRRIIYGMQKINYKTAGLFGIYLSYKKLLTILFSRDLLKFGDLLRRLVIVY